MTSPKLTATITPKFIETYLKGCSNVEAVAFVGFPHDDNWIFKLAVVTDRDLRVWVLRVRNRKPCFIVEDDLGNVFEFEALDELPEFFKEVCH